MVMVVSCVRRVFWRNGVTLTICPFHMNASRFTLNFMVFDSNLDPVHSASVGSVKVAKLVGG